MTIQKPSDHPKTEYEPQNRVTTQKPSMNPKTEWQRESESSDFGAENVVLLRKNGEEFSQSNSGYHRIGKSRYDLTPYLLKSAIY